MSGWESLGIAPQTVTGSVCALTLCSHLIQAGKVTSSVLPWPLGPSPTMVLGAVQRQKLFFSSGSDKSRQKYCYAPGQDRGELPQTLLRPQHLSPLAEHCSFPSPAACTKDALVYGGIITGFCSISWVGNLSSFASPLPISSFQEHLPQMHPSQLPFSSKQNIWRSCWPKVFRVLRGLSLGATGAARHSPPGPHRGTAAYRLTLQAGAEGLQSQTPLPALPWALALPRGSGSMHDSWFSALHPVESPEVKGSSETGKEEMRDAAAPLLLLPLPTKSCPV